METIQNEETSSAKDVGALLLIGFSVAFVAFGTVKIIRYASQKQYMKFLERKFDEQKAAREK
jgi:hypothetical protein